MGIESLRTLAARALSSQLDPECISQLPDALHESIRSCGISDERQIELFGDFVLYHDNGVVMWRAEASQGVLCGDSWWFDTDGVPSAYEQRRWGVRHGSCIGYWKNGRRKFREHWKAGKLHGWRVDYSETGEVLIQDLYINGKWTKTAGLTTWFLNLWASLSCT